MLYFKGKKWEKALFEGYGKVVSVRQQRGEIFVIHLNNMNMNIARK